MRFAWLALIVACSGEPAAVDLLPPADRAIRVSMAVRGVRPTVAELDRVRRDPAALDALVDAWIEDPRFEETVRDLHAEVLWLRTDTQPTLPPVGPLAGRTRGEVQSAIAEGPLQRIASVVTRGRPYRELLSTNETMVNEVLADVYGLPWDPAGPDWQVARWTDGRPAAGLLSENGLWLRHISSDTNHHRARAAAVLRVFLCDDLSGRDLGVLGIDLTAADAVVDAVSTQPACTGCHDLLDPVAGLFWGYKRYILRSEVSDAYRAGCLDDDYCYPIGLYDPEREGQWHEAELPPTGLGGRSLVDLADLGAAIVADPAFGACTARRFAGYLWQVDPDDVDVAPLAVVFERANQDARALVKAIVLDPAFLAASAPRQVVRPEQYARMLEDLTGFRWTADPDPPGCADAFPTCWGTVDLLNDDLYGFRLLAGGIDGYAVRRPTHAPTPTQVLVFERAAVEAAGFVVARDLADPASARLLRLVGPDTVNEVAVRAQIAALHHRILGEVLAPYGGAIEDSVDLWTDALGRHGRPSAAWQLLVAALLVDARAVTY